MRADHERLHGIIKPIDDPFWSRYYPPLDWRCRCDVRATAADPTNDKEEVLPRVQFEGNVGKDKEIFTREGTFFRLIAGDENAKRSQELAKLNAPYTQEYTHQSKKLWVNIFADKEDKDTNIGIGKITVRSEKINLWIRPHVEAQGVKNPEFYDGKIIGDLAVKKSSNPAKYISNTFDDKFGVDGQLRDQDSAFLILSFNNMNLTADLVSKISRQLWGKLNHYTRCEYVILENNGNTIRVDNNFTNYGDFERAFTP